MCNLDSNFVGYKGSPDEFAVINELMGYDEDDTDDDEDLYNDEDEEDDDE